MSGRPSAAPVCSLKSQWLLSPAASTTRRSVSSPHRPRAWLLNGVKKVEQLRFLTDDGATLGQKALRYVLREPEVVSALANI